MKESNGGREAELQVSVGVSGTLMMIPESDTISTLSSGTIERRYRLPGHDSGADVTCFIWISRITVNLEDADGGTVAPTRWYIVI